MHTKKIFGCCFGSVKNHKYLRHKFVEAEIQKSNPKAKKLIIFSSRYIYCSRELIPLSLIANRFCRNTKNLCDFHFSSDSSLRLFRSRSRFALRLFRNDSEFFAHSLKCKTIFCCEFLSNY